MKNNLVTAAAVGVLMATSFSGAEVQGSKTDLVVVGSTPTDVDGTRINEGPATDNTDGFQPGRGVEFKVTNSHYRLTNPSAPPGIRSLPGLAIHKTEVHGDFVLRVLGHAEPSAAQDDFAVVFCVQDDGTYYLASFHEVGDGEAGGLFKVVRGDRIVRLISFATPIRVGTDHRIEIRRIGNTISVLQDSAALGSCRDGTWIAGRVGFGCSGAAGRFAELVVTMAHQPAPLATALQPLPLDAVKWTPEGPGFMHRKVRLAVDRLIPGMEKICLDSSIRNLRANAIGRRELTRCTDSTYLAGDGEIAKWLEAVVRLYAQTGDASLRTTLNEYVRLFSSAQASDGYLYSTYQVDPSAPKPFSGNFGSHMYCFGYLMEFAVAHRRVTGETAMLEVARRLADCAYRNYIGQGDQHAHPGIISGLLALHVETGDRRYLVLAETMLRRSGDDLPYNRDPQYNFSEYIKDVSEVYGHAQCKNQWLQVATEVYEHTSDPGYLAMLAPRWKEIATERMLIHGGAGPHHAYLHPKRRTTYYKDGSLHESYGASFDMPTESVYCEGCANYFLAAWSHAMFDATGRSEYLDVVEQVLFNALLGGVQWDDAKFFYHNDLNMFDSSRPHMEERQRAADPPGWNCCPPNYLRAIARSTAWAYAVNGHGVYVNLFGSNTVDAELPGIGRIALRQTSDYPYGSNVVLVVTAVNSTGPFAIAPRIPVWAVGTTVRVNGQELVGIEPGRHFVITRTWAIDDRIELVFGNFNPRVIHGDPRSPQLKGQRCVFLGPLLYVAEQPDLTVDPKTLAMPASAALTSHWKADLFGGVRIVSGTFKSNGKDTPVTMIPYHLWNNRGKTSMRVWFPTAP